MVWNNNANIVSSYAQIPSLVLPSYDSLQRAPHSRYSNPLYDDQTAVEGGRGSGEGGGGEEVEGEIGEEEELNFDDLPPPYSPGVRGGEGNDCQTKKY